MEGNYAIIEVKPFRAKTKGIEKDLRTLTTFLVHWGYQRAILLLYGGRAAQCFERVRLISNRIDNLPHIEIWHHAHPGTGAVCLGMVGEGRAAA
jgi:hypothetical protein